MGIVAVGARVAGGERENNREMITTQKGRALNKSDGLLDRMVGRIIQEALRYQSGIGTVAGGVTLTWALASLESEYLEMPVGFYGVEEATLASATRYAKLVFSVLSQYPILVLLRLSSPFYSSTITGTGEENDLVDLGATR